MPSLIRIIRIYKDFVRNLIVIMSPRTETDNNSDDQNEEIEILHTDRTLIINGLLFYKLGIFR